MTYLITGATGALGKEVALRLARLGVTALILPTRDEAGAAELRDGLRAAGCTHVQTPVLELSSLSSVRRFVEAMQEQLPARSLKGLLLNAGRQSAHRMEYTEDGLEATFAVNHLAHHAVLKGLSSRLGTDAVVGWTASGTHDPRELSARLSGFRGGRYSTARLVAKGHFDGAKSVEQACRDAYATSKLCNMLVARHFGRVEEGAQRFFSFDPGLMPGTGLAREQGRIARAAWNHLLPRLVPLLPGASTPARSGRVLAELLTGHLAGPNGSYYNYTGRVLEPWLPANESETVADLLDVSDALLRTAVQAERRLSPSRLVTGEPGLEIAA